MISGVLLLILSVSNANEFCVSSANMNVVKGTWSNLGDCNANTHSAANEDSNAGNIIWFGSADGQTPDAAYDSTDFTLSVEMEVDTNGGDAGFLFRASQVSVINDGGNHYYIGLYPGGNRVIFGYMANSWNVLQNVAYTIDPNIRYTVTVEARGSYYKVYINNVLIIPEFQDTRYPSGTIGLRTFHSPATYHSMIFTPDCILSEEGQACTDDDDCSGCHQCCPQKKVCEVPPSAHAQEMLNELNNEHGVIPGKKGSYQEPMFGYILMVGVILFILINNVFIGYWCVCKKSNVKADEEYEKCQMINIDDE